MITNIDPRMLSKLPIKATVPVYQPANDMSFYIGESGDVIVEDMRQKMALVAVNKSEIKEFLEFVSESAGYHIKLTKHGQQK